MSPEPFVRLERISKVWKGSHGVQEIDLAIPEGSFVALLGPSGCGKSTTLRLLAGLETPDGGRILIRGADVTAAPPSQRNLSMVFQSYALFPHLSVAENILFGLKVRKVPRAERGARLGKALEMTGLRGFERRKPGEISGGQRQRVALARAIVAGHPLCLMDEPLSNLDAKLRHSVRKDIKRLQRDLGMTVIYVTHDQTEAMSMADIVVLMREGRIEQVGTPAALYNAPQSVFVAGFVGSPPMALIEPSVLPDLAGGQDVLFGVRPEHLQLVDAGDGPGGPRLCAEVAECEYMGAETFLSFVMPGSSGLTVRLPGERHMTPGTPVTLGFDRSRLHRFDRKSGRRLPASEEAGAPA